MSDDRNHNKPPVAVGVCFRRSGKVYYFKSAGAVLEPGEFVVAETQKGLDLGQVVHIKQQLADGDSPPTQSLIRKAQRDDMRCERHLREKEARALETCAEQVAAHDLDMKLVEADYTLDGKHLTLFFTAEHRIDFRELVHDLTRTFHCRIELRQIGVRDEAKLIGGLGCCGRPLCCTTFLRDFESVGIRLAKDQQLSLSPENITGVCDRLMCCLRFEHDYYVQAAKQLPAPGTVVSTQQGRGQVVGRHLLKKTVVVKLEDDKELEMPVSEVTP